MKPARFDYYAPQGLDEALGLLAQYGDDAKVLAGGQSLMPLMAMRLARPAVVVDINRISSLSYINPTNQGGLDIGALTRQRMVEHSDLVRQHNPLLSAIIPHIGHFQIRNRGTIGGSLAHSDPSAELPAFALVSGATLDLASASALRQVEAADFFVTYFSTALEPNEILAAIHVPPLSAGWGWGFHEMCRRQGDFALVGATTLVHLDSRGTCDDARVVVFGVGGAPVLIEGVADILAGSNGDDGILQDIEEVVSNQVDPDSDIHASATYRKEVAGVMARRALADAFRRAKGENGR